MFGYFDPTPIYMVNILNFVLVTQFKLILRQSQIIPRSKYTNLPMDHQNSFSLKLIFKTYCNIIHTYKAQFLVIRANIIEVNNSSVILMTKLYQVQSINQFKIALVCGAVCTIRTTKSPLSNAYPIAEEGQGVRIFLYDFSIYFL